MQELFYARHPKHRDSGQKLALSKTVVASFGIGAIAVSGFTAFAVEAEAATTCPVGTTATVDRAGTCEKVFTTPGLESWTKPVGVTAFEALLVGGGGAANAWVPEFYGGGGGEVKVKTFTASESSIDIVVGAGGATSAQPGSASVVRVAGTPVETASGGLGGTADGSATNGGPGAGGPSFGADFINGGPGIDTSSLSGTMFATLSECFGGGGAGYGAGNGVSTCGGAMLLAQPIPNSGGGGSSTVIGASGQVIIRFSPVSQPIPSSPVISEAPAIPLVTGYSKKIVIPGDRVQVIGQLLGTVQAARINGEPTLLTDVSSTTLNLVVPVGLSAGTYDLELLGSFGTLIEKSPFTIEKKQIKRLVPGFAGDSPVMTIQVASTIRSTLNRLPGAVTLVCTGSTSNTRVTAFDKRLATQRATRACARAKALNPELTTQIRIAPASGVGPQARNIRMVLRNY